MKCRKKHIEVEAIQFTYDNIKKIKDLTTEKTTIEVFRDIDENGFLFGEPLCEITTRINLGDFVIKGEKGEIYTCGRKVFVRSYADIQKRTVFDKIKTMNIDEMAIFLNEFDCLELCEHQGSCKTSNDCINGLKKYLEMEIE